MEPYFINDLACIKQRRGLLFRFVVHISIGKILPALGKLAIIDELMIKAFEMAKYGESHATYHLP